MADGRLTFDTKLDNSGVTSGIKGIGSAALKASAGIMTAGSAAAAAMTKMSVDAYASYEQLVGGVDTLFKKSSDQVQKYADNAYITAGMSANQYMETVTSFSASLLQSLDGDTDVAAKKADKAITDMSDNANKMGTDIAMIQNAYQGFAKQNYTMLDNLKLGYGGTKEEMQRLLDDASKLSGIKYDISSYADIVDAIHAVQKEMGIAGTTEEEASETIEGSVNSAKAAWENLMVGLADDNADFETLVNNFVDSVSTAASNILPRIETTLGGIGLLIEKMLPIMVNAIPDIIENLLPGLLSSGTNIVLTLIQGVAAAIPSLLNVFPEIIRTIGASLIGAGPQLFASASEVLVQLLAFTLEEIPKIFDGISEFFSGSGFSNITEMVMTLISQLLISLLNSLPNIISSIVGMIPAIVDGLLSAIPILIEAIPPIIDALITGLLESIPAIIDAGVELITSLVDDLPAIINTLVEAIPEIITNLIDAILENLPAIIDAGFELLSALIDALPDIITTITKALPKLIDGIVKALIKAVPKIVSTGIKLLGSLVKNLPKIISKVVSAIPEIINSIEEGFDDFKENMADIGLNLIKGLWNGIKDAGAWLKEKLSGFVDGVIEDVKDFFDIHSPSRKFKWIGQMCVEGFEEPLEEYNPYDTLNASMKASKNTLKMNYNAGLSTSGLFDYDRMGEKMVGAFEKAGLTVTVGNREFGRIVRAVV